MESKWKGALRQDLSAYRCIPFWSWNDKLKDEELIRQIRQMKDAGMGGFFMHARSGLQTEYLSDEWFHAVDICKSEAESLGMNAWCYDENGWPSGFAGMKLLEDPDNWAHYLICRETDYFDPLALAVYYLDGDILKRADSLTKRTNYWCVYDCTNGSVVDVLNPKIVSKFIQETHERYFLRFYADFGRSLMGFFTDEPQYFRWETAYSPVILQIYQNNYHENLLDVLGALFVECRQAPEVRFRYWRLMNRLFTDSFIHQVYDWCEAHGCKLTGHAIEEQRLSTQMWCCAGVMPFYEYEHIPGVDWLGREIGTEITPRQVSSVAQQLGKPQVLTETFACTGWDVTPRELKRIGEWQYVHGVNLMCVHLFPYSIRGNRKKDHPCFFSEHNPWFNHLKEFNDYFTALGFMLSQSEEVIHTAVIHPMHSAYLTYDHQKDYESVALLEESFADLVERLGAAHIGHHYIDESLLEKHGKVENDNLIMGNCRYNTVIIPNMPCLDQSTATLLQEFICNGGRIYLDGQRPTRIDGRLADMSWLEANTSWQELSQDEIRIDNPKTDVRTTYRRSEKGDFLFTVNLSQDTAYTLTYDVRAAGAALFSPLHGDCRPLCFTSNRDRISFPLHFEPGDSYIVLLNDVKPASCCIPEQYKQHGSEELPPISSLLSCDDNSLKLDYVEISYDSVDYSSPIPIPAAADYLLRQRKNCDVYLKYTFSVQEVPKTLMAEIEPMNVKAIWINDQKVESTEEGTLEKAFLRVNLQPFIHIGKNSLVCKIHYNQPDNVYEVLFDRDDVTESLINCLTYDTEIDSVYLRGQFGVQCFSEYEEVQAGVVLTEGPFTISSLPRELNCARINRQGFPFFAGYLTLQFSVTLQQTEYLLKLHGRYATAQFNINGVELPPLVLEDTLDAHTALRIGENQIRLTLCCSNRNLFGPSHVKNDPEPLKVFPDYFDLGTEWSDGKNPRYTNKYSFVDFGLDALEWLPLHRDDH